MGSYAPPLYREWQCPPNAVADDYKIGWLNENTEEAQAWLKSQRGMGDVRKALDTLAGRDTGIKTAAAYRSQLNPNRLKRNVREIVGTLAKLRPIWGYHSDNQSFKSQAEMFNKVTRAWYLESMADRSIREALQYAAATCRGWVVPMYRRQLYGQGRGEIKLFTYGAPCVIPTQLPSSNDYQSAYTMTILDEMPVAMAHAMFPLFQDKLRPSSARYWYQNDAVRQAARGNFLQRIFRRNTMKGDTELSELLVPIRRTYVIDCTVNTTDQAIPMGEPGSSWFYTVPFVGQDIPAGTDLRTGQMTYRKANENDARLYPTRRLLISTDRCIMYDGPNFDWHDMFPGVSFCMDDWAWEPLGFSLVHDGYDLNEAIKTLVRGNMDKAVAQTDMSLAYDTNAVSMAEARAFDPMQPRNRIGFDGSAIDGQPFTPVVPPEVLKIDEGSIKMIEYLEQAMDGQLAVRDAIALAQMRAVGSMDELEKIVETNGPIIEDMSRCMEPPMRDLGYMLKFNIMQWETTSRVMQYVGPDGVSRAVFDYDPTSLVPSHGPGENPSSPSLLSPRQRARTFADNLRFFVLPNSLHEYAQMAMKLALVQLRKAGIKIDSQTVAEAFNVPNYGTIDGSTVIEKFEAEQEMDLVHAAKMQMIAQAEGLMPPLGAPGAGAPPGAPKPNGAAPEGRPPSGGQSPRIVSKEGGARSTISESGS